MHGALLLSVVAHGFVAGWVVTTWQDLKPAASVGRNKGALQVTLRRDAAPAAKPVTATPERSSTSSAPRKQRARQERATTTPKPMPVAAVTAAAPSPAPDEKPGARFASLFAPIVHAPIGNAGWSSNRTRTQAPPPLSPEQERAQALMAMRASLQSRFASLADQLRAAQAQIACDLVIDIEHRIGQLDCAEPQQQAIAWGVLQGTLVGGLVSDAAQRLCLRLSDGQVLDAACTSAPTP